jgi:hypothetical protein
MGFWQRVNDYILRVMDEEYGFLRNEYNTLSNLKPNSNSSEEKKYL